MQKALPSQGKQSAEPTPGRSSAGSTGQALVSPKDGVSSSPGCRGGRGSQCLWPEAMHKSISTGLSRPKRWDQLWVLAPGFTQHGSLFSEFRKALPNCLYCISVTLERMKYLGQMWEELAWTALAKRRWREALPLPVLCKHSHLPPQPGSAWPKQGSKLRGGSAGARAELEVHTERARGSR